MVFTSSAGIASWIVWAVWIIVGAGWELWTVFTEKKRGFLPLTRVVRDRLMRRNTVVKIGMLGFLTWLWVHFITPVPF